MEANLRRPQFCPQWDISFLYVLVQDKSPQSTSTNGSQNQSKQNLGFALGFETVVHPPGEKAAGLALCKATKPGDPKVLHPESSPLWWPLEEGEVPHM